jgi:UDP-sugar transporter A1/2/3
MFRFGILALLAAQNAGQTLIIKYAQHHGSHPDTLVLMVVVELGKLVVSMVLFFLFEADVTWIQFFSPSAVRRSFKLAPPALMFALQNQILFVAVQNLDPPVFQALTQLKILFAGVFSYVLLNKRLSQVQWVALLLLASGAALVQVEASMCKAGSNKNVDADPFRGLVAVITMSVMSGLAGCYTEKMLKTEKLPMWLQSAEVAGFSIVVLTFMCLWSRVSMISLDMNVLDSKRPDNIVDSLMKGFVPLTWVVVAVMSLGGLIVVAALRYADNVMKGMSVVASLVLSGMWSALAFGTSLSAIFVLATIVICAAMFLYQAVPFVASSDTAQNHAVLRTISRTAVSPGKKAAESDEETPEEPMRVETMTPKGSE